MVTFVAYKRERIKPNLTFVKFADRLRTVLKDRGVKPAELVRATGLSSGAVSNYLDVEKDRVPKSEELLRIAQFLRLPMEELLTGEKRWVPTADWALMDDARIREEEPTPSGVESLKQRQLPKLNDAERAEAAEQALAEIKARLRKILADF